MTQCVVRTTFLPSYVFYGPIMVNQCRNMSFYLRAFQFVQIKLCFEVDIRD